MTRPEIDVAWGEPVGERVPCGVGAQWTNRLSRPPRVQWAPECHELPRCDGSWRFDRPPGDMSYRVKEMFPTLQGEGMNAGRVAVFCRFTGCNLWSGHEAQRSSAVCRFCDTDFVGTDGPGGGVFTDSAGLVEAIASQWSGATGEAPASASAGVVPLVVFTGGEPLLQLDGGLVEAVSVAGFEVAVETNGTIPLPAGIDWVCVSPKAGSDVVVRSGDELKVVYPQAGLDPDSMRPPEWEFGHFLVQPMDGPERAANTAAAVRYCLAHPRWRLSVQTHKELGIP